MQNANEMLGFLLDIDHMCRVAASISGMLIIPLMLGAMLFTMTRNVTKEPTAKLFMGLAVTCAVILVPSLTVVIFNVLMRPLA